jgi:hypothetical protein
MAQAQAWAKQGREPEEIDRKSTLKVFKISYNIFG